MSGLLAALRYARWPFLFLTVALGAGCAVARLARWPLLLFAVAAAVGCGTVRDYGECEDDYEDYQANGSRRGGSVSPGHLNARPGYLNG